MLGLATARAAARHAALPRLPSLASPLRPLALPRLLVERSAACGRLAAGRAFCAAALGGTAPLTASTAKAAGEAVARPIAAKLVKAGYENQVGVWLLGTSALLYTMIGIGGYTRLSGSGLSMTDWRIEGRRLPWSESEWVREFEEYQQFPEYQRLNKGMMDLDDFKRIYFVEWFHRMWGRSVGVLFAVPLVYFSARRILKAPLAMRLTALFGLGLSQAVVGWWMVKSGLEAPEKHTPTLGANQRPRVSPYRLASHWTAALTIYIGIFWTSLSLLRPSPATLHTSIEAISAAKRLRIWALPVTALVGLTLLSGPFVAGNDAGRAYNTWPKMNYDWVPPEVSTALSAPLDYWRYFFEDTAVVQFNHRGLAYSSVASSLLLFGYSTRLALAPAACTAAWLLPVAVGGQMCLGIATLLLYVPTELGVAHQAGGVVVLTTLAYLLHTLRTPAIIL